MAKKPSRLGQHTDIPASIWMPDTEARESTSEVVAVVPMRTIRLRTALILAPLVTGCYTSHEVAVLGVEPLDGAVHAAPVAADGGPLGSATTLPPGCADPGDQLPLTLECTGLYSSLLEKRVAPGVRPFAPAVWLWSDGADKQRWIQLPEGATIDTSNSNEWSFPVGTKAWKEFKHNGQRIETRIFSKVNPDTWRFGAYIWKNDETATELSFGADLPVSDGVYHVPTTDECLACHKGRTERLLGFEAPLLGLPGAEGVTLAMLAAEGRLSAPPGQTQYQMPDDGTQLAGQALSWLHVNCGVSCHNENPNATGYKTGMFLRIDPSKLQSGPLSGWNSLTTTLNVSAQTTAFLGSLRIVPGSPEQSLVVRLAGTRGSNQQMPPIASKVVDEKNLAVVREWIRRLGSNAAIPAAPQPAGVSPSAP